MAFFSKLLKMEMRRFVIMFRSSLRIILFLISPKMGVTLFIIISLWMLGLMNYINFEEDTTYISRKIEESLKNQLKYDAGTGCVIPHLDPFSYESTRNDKVATPIKCNGTNWVKCYLSRCQVLKKILYTYTNISCSYRDIIFKTDFLYYLGKPIKLVGSAIYHLRTSDHVNVTCTGFKGKSLLPTTWSGNLAGFRSEVSRITPPKGREDTINILMFTFDSSARIRFIRRMPKSYKYLTEDLQATVLNNYNIAGDGTKEIFTMILTGNNLYELPTIRPRDKRRVSCDVFPFIFYKLKDDGYRTAYLEDGPDYGTYQWDANGFHQMPTDHYASTFNTHNRIFSYYSKGCLGDTPQNKIMMDLNLQFMRLDGKKFILTIVADISHDDYNLITNADENFVNFLKAFRQNGHEKNTLLIVMGDHGPRFGIDRSTPQARLEERLPLMALRLPEKLIAERPDAIKALKINANSLTAPYDIHATLLDAVGLRKYWNPYRIPGCNHPRGRTLLEPIPVTRSCSEAGITPHYCACVQWRNISQNNRIYKMAGEAFVNYVNYILQPVRLLCKPRTLASIIWVKLLSSHVVSNQPRYYQIKVKLDPEATFEATMTYIEKEDKFEITRQDISRTSVFGNESACIEKTHRHLRKYCFCYG